MRQNSNKLFTLIFQVNYQKCILISYLIYGFNYSYNSPEGYYKISVFLPCLGNFIFHLENRFEQNNDIVSLILFRKKFWKIKKSQYLF